jgi:23S rRNA (uracil1939-C5)-methyltransferase
MIVPMACGSLVKIRSLGVSGEGVGTIDGYAIFVDGALPGEEVEVELVAKKPRYGMGRPLRWHSRSRDRVEPACPVYGRCGGCQLMHLSYEGQLTAKRQRVVDALERLGGLEGVDVAPCLPAPSPWAYRHKIQLPVSHDLQLGLYERGSHRLVPVDGCLIHCPQGEQLLGQLKPLIKEVPPGLLRYLVVRGSSQGGQLLILVTRETEPLRAFADQAMARAPSLRGVVACRNTRSDNRILTGEWQLLAGQDHILEQVAGLQFRISAGSFFQVYPAQAGQLVRLVEEWAGPGRGRRAVDGCCGVGLMALALARQGWQVLGIEIAPEAVADARYNAQLNQLSVTFECRPMGPVDAELLLLNPPRGGMDGQVLKTIQAERILYISCDPATLARDIRRLQGYRPTRVQPVDLFPQTAHVETIVLLERL